MLVLTGGAGDDTLDGGGGADTLSGGYGNDSLAGGADNDSLSGDSGADTLSGDAGDDTLSGYGLLQGGADNDSLQGGGTLEGGAGNDTLFNSYGLLQGGAGEDSIYGYGTLEGGAGNDSLSGTNSDTYRFALGDGQDAISDNYDGGYSIYTYLGFSYGYVYVGPSAPDTLAFGDGITVGMVGAQRVGDDLVLSIAGGDGLTISAYFVEEQRSGWFYDAAGQLQNGLYWIAPYQIEMISFADGTSWTPTQVANLAITATAGNDTLTGTRDPNTFAGLAGHDSLDGRDGADTLNGGSGADTLAGGAGDDVYVVDSLLDVVVELPGGGTDTIRTALSTFTLGAGVENLVYTGASGFRGTGNADANQIAGGNAADTLDGGAGADTLIGGAGNDLYLVDDAGDAVIEAGGGLDTVRTTLATFDLGALAEVENLVYAGVGAFAGTGNALANRMSGGGANDSLFGAGGADSLVGGAGADTLDGGSDADTLAGGAGDDTYLVDAALDRVVEGTGGGFDTVRTTLGAYVLASQVEALVFIGAGDFAGTGNTAANALLGRDGADTLNGGSGADTLTGGLGDDVYVVDSLLDVVVELLGGGTDTIRTALSTFTLGAGVENLVYTGASGFRGTGNADANQIAGGNAADTLDGGAGADTLIGGAGNDMFRFVAGACDGDAVTDFDGASGLLGDRLVFVGFGSSAAGARLEQLDSTAWQAISSDGLMVATIRLLNAANIDPGDVSFI